METKKEETASFVVRFTQKVFTDESGESQVQWRGNIQHVQGGDEKRFSDFEEVIKFIQSKLTSLTLEAIGDKSPEEQQGILHKSFELWKTMTYTYPQQFLEAFTNPELPAKQMEQQLNAVQAFFTQGLQLDAWMQVPGSKTSQVSPLGNKLLERLERLEQKVDRLLEKD